MPAEKSQLDYPKVSAGLFTILIAITGWFSVTMYEKITKIEENIQQLLVASGIEKTEITNLKQRVDNLENDSKKNKTSHVFLNKDAVLPDVTTGKKSKEYFASK
jgi:hypothetical protein